MTMDAGGTNLVFSAIQSGEEIVPPVTLPSYPSNLRKCLDTIISGFEDVKKILIEEPVAISFAFPGPADYDNGVIGDLSNFPSFRGGVALGPLLKKKFEVPVIISNDGDLFTLGEAVAGFLPDLNQMLKENELQKEYTNLIGITLGTGFGCGIVVNNMICRGDNSAAGEMWIMRNYKEPEFIAEEGVSIRGIQRFFSHASGEDHNYTPKEIHEIALGKRKGNKAAAIKAFEEMAVVIAEALANAIILIDGPVVIGGGMAGASELLIPRIVDHLNGSIQTYKGEKISRLVSNLFNMEDSSSCSSFYSSVTEYVEIPFTKQKVIYNRSKAVPVGKSKLGTSRAICIGAYAVALTSLDQKMDFRGKEKNLRAGSSTSAGLL